MLLQFLLVLAQEKTIRGRVTSETGVAVSGASVQIKGTQVGTTTNNNGEFTITATKGATLVITNIGYGQKEIVVSDDNQVSV